MKSFGIKNILVKACVAALIALLVITACAALMHSAPAVASADNFSVDAKAAYLCDYATGSVIYAKDENKRLPIASMSKIMTALLTLEAVERKELDLNEEITISEEAAGMGGSQVFLDAGSVHKAGDLLKTVIVASANDSCVALGERLCGSITGFVNAMNRRAKELKMENTNFANCTGLPAPENFSSAKDVSTMFKELIKHPVYFDYSGIWLEDYVHPDGRKTTITNTNKLVRFYKGCDGGKTGFTSEAKFCLAATAKRGDMRLVGVVIGADSSKGRFAAVSEMFNYGFGNYENKILVKAGDSIENEVKVTGGKKTDIELTPARDITRFMSRNDSASYEIRYELPAKVKAKIKAGDKIGKAYLTKDGVVIDEIDILSKEDIGRSNIFDEIKRIGEGWCKYR